MSPVAVITGATDGIGRATARRLLREGWEVVVVGRSRPRCDATVEALRAELPGAAVSAVVADLSRMTDVRRAAGEIAAAHDRLDLLLLNANAITQEHVLTPDGFEANLAIGHLGRALLAWSLEGPLRATPGAQVLTVVGLNLERIDLDDPPGPVGFSSMKALGRWQWAVQVFAREWNQRGPVPMNVYMPGLVQTKILADEPQPMRLFVWIANRIIGVPVDRAGDELVAVIDEVRRTGRRDGYYARTKLQAPRDLKERPGDGPRLWAATARLLTRWTAPA